MSCIIFACLEECCNNCEVGHLCQNKCLTCKEWKKVQVFDASVKGKGLCMLQPIKEGELITKYVGQTISKEYLNHLFQQYGNEQMLYIMALDKDMYIDAYNKPTSPGLSTFFSLKIFSLTKYICTWVCTYIFNSCNA